MIKLINGDCYKEIKKLEDKSINFIYFNPPFGVSEQLWDNSLDYTKLWDDMWRVLKPRGVVAIHCSGKFTHSVISTQFKNFKYCWYWDKKCWTGHLRSKVQPMRHIEEIAIFYKKGCDINIQRTLRDKPIMLKHSMTNYYNGNRGNSGIKKECKYKYPSHYLVYKRRNHKYSTRPVDLCEYMIKTYSNEGDTVLDLTMSDAQSGIACKNLNRDYIGFEIDETRYNDAVENNS